MPKSIHLVNMAKNLFKEQRDYTRTYLLPLLKTHLGDLGNMSILEVGCAEAGLIQSFREEGIEVEGVEIVEGRAKVGMEKIPEARILVGDITDEGLVSTLGKTYDLIIMRDVIEHVPKREKAFEMLDRLLKPGGHLYISFPGRYSPYAGHQQNCKSFLKYIPYLHLLNKRLLDWLGRVNNEPQKRMDIIKENWRIGLSYAAFRKHVRAIGLRPVRTDLYLIRPVYLFRFNKKWLKAIRTIKVPVVQEIFAMGVEALLVKPNK